MVPSIRILFFIVLLISLVGCSGSRYPEQPTAEISSTQTVPSDHFTTRLSTATAAAFELKATSTPLPTATLISSASLSGPGFNHENLPEGVNPLTGLAVADPKLLERRPMVIKITNFPRDVRPQWGLGLADHIYEYYMEDGLTRFIGIFYGQDADRVGPIRSARPFDEHIVRMYKAIFAFGYADDRVIDLWKDSDLKNRLVIERPDNCPPMCRIGSENNYNTLFTDTSQLSQYITERGTDNARQNLSGLHFEGQSYVTGGGGRLDRLEIRFSPSSYHYWEYDPASKRYLRWQDADRAMKGEETYQPLLDSLTNQQIAADNIFILLVPTGYFFQSNSTEIFDIQLMGQGAAYAIRNGKIFEVNWKRPTPEALLSITFPGGAPFPLKPGNVWFEVLSEISTHEVADSTWKFLFDIKTE